MKTTASAKGRPVSEIEIDAGTLARVIREQKALPITDDEAETLARALETSNDDEEFLASALSTVRFLVDQLEPLVPDPVEHTNPTG
jgi:Arc/MetJ family transcription regulator